MVKRKTSISIDAWLDKGLNPLTTESTSTLATENCEAPNQRSNAEEVHPEVNVPVWTGGLINATSEATPSANVLPTDVASQPAQRVVTSEPAAGAREGPQLVNEVIGDMARDEGEGAEWFWRLLEQDGYERW